MKNCGDRTKSKINWLVGLERRPFTTNESYFLDYKDKFLSYYRAARRPDNDLISRLAANRSEIQNNVADDFQRGLGRVLSGLPQIGINGVMASDLPRLLAPDPMEPALKIMASVRAYFQGRANFFLCYFSKSAHHRHLQLHIRDSRILFHSPSTTNLFLVLGATWSLYYTRVLTLADPMRNKLAGISPRSRRMYLLAGLHFANSWTG